jgi:hypothetical protein
VTTGVLLAIGPLLLAAGVDIVRDGPVPVERGLLHVGRDGVEVELGALLELGLRAGQGTRLDLPAARLRLDALVETAVPLGMRLELEASPFVDVDDNLNGPGLLRDAYLRLGLGNKKVLDLGEVQLGQLAVPSSLESLRPPERWRFTHRPLVEERALPGRDLGFVYHVDYGAHGWPLAAWVGSFAGAGANRVDASLSPLVALRLELRPLPRTAGSWLELRSGVALVSQATDPDLPLLLLVDATARAHRWALEAQAVLGDAPDAALLERGALRGELSVEVLPDFWALHLRHEIWALDAGSPRHRLSLGAVTTYLDDAFQIIADVTWPLGPGWGREGVELAVAFRLWW